MAPLNHVSKGPGPSSLGPVCLSPFQLKNFKLSIACVSCRKQAAQENARTDPGAEKGSQTGLQGASGDGGVGPGALAGSGVVSQEGSGGSQRVALRIVRTADQGFVIWGPSDGLDAGVRQSLVV